MSEKFVYIPFSYSDGRMLGKQWIIHKRHNFTVLVPTLFVSWPLHLLSFSHSNNCFGYQTLHSSKASVSLSSIATELVIDWVVNLYFSYIPYISRSFLPLGFYSKLFLWNSFWDFCVNIFGNIWVDLFGFSLVLIISEPFIWGGSSLSSS